MADEKNKLTDEEIENVSGGQIFYAKNISNADPDKLWEVLNEKGEVVDRAETRDKAIWLAGKHDVNFEEVKWEDVQKMRGQ